MAQDMAGTQHIADTQISKECAVYEEKDVTGSPSIFKIKSIRMIPQVFNLKEKIRRDS